MDTTVIGAIWSRLSATAAEALRMTDVEAERFRSSSVAKLVGLLPFVAGCDDPERTALSHLSTWVIANRGRARRAFDHAPADDGEPLARLRTIASFEGGDAGIIARGMALLGLCMVAGYRRDADADALMGTYNPVAEKTWDADSLEADLGATVAAKASAELDAIMTADDAVRSYWED